jgi:tRNA U34 5-carboxymethylaminomethyl modifying GTPase MnmE/TrmE
MGTTKTNKARPALTGKPATLEKTVGSRAEQLKHSTRELARQGLERRAHKLGFAGADHVLMMVKRRAGLSTKSQIRAAALRRREQAAMVLRLVDLVNEVLTYVEDNFVETEAADMSELRSDLRRLYVPLQNMARPYPKSTCHALFTPKHRRVLVWQKTSGSLDNASKLERVVWWSLRDGAEAQGFRAVDVARIAILLGYFPQTADASLKPPQLIDRAATAVRQCRKRFFLAQKIQTSGR